MADKRVAVIMGSDSDYPHMRGAVDILSELGISVEARVVSAHRTPELMADFAKSAEDEGFQVIIAGAGGAAHLPGMVAAHTTIPVIGVPVPIGHLDGQDALLSIVQMPRGVPVATVAIGNSTNAGILAAQIIGHGGSQRDSTVVSALKNHRKSMQEASLNKKVP